MKIPSIAFALVVGSLVGCGEMPDGADDESVTQETSALGTLPTGKFELHNYDTGQCLGTSAGTPNWGTPFITWWCDGSANQTYSVLPKRGVTGVIELKDYVAANKCLHTSNANNGTEATVFWCESDYSQQITGWKPIYSGTDLSGHECYRFQKEGATTVLGVAGGNRNPGTKTIMWTDYNNAYYHPDQFWCVYPVY